MVIIIVSILLLVALIYIVVTWPGLGRRECSPCSNTGIRVGTSPLHGLGVFATRPYRSGELVERCRALTIKDTDITVTSRLVDYVFEAKDKRNVLIALGSCSIYNHSESNNADFTIVGETVEIRAVKPIAKGEEICIHYGDDYWKLRGMRPSD